MMVGRVVAFMSIFVILEGLPKFFQGDWNLKHHVIEVEDYNRSVISDPHLCFFTYNRTVKDKLINGSLTFLVEGGHGSTVHASVFKFLSNEYRPFPINVAFNLCEEFNKNTFGMQGILNHSNWRGCPAKKGRYYIENYRIQQELFPPHIPTGKYKVVANVFLSRDSFAVRIAYYGEVLPVKLV